MKRKSLAVAVTALLAVAATSFALWFILGNIEGQGHFKNGKATPTTIPATVEWAPEVLVAGGSTPITLKINNNVPGAVAFELKQVAFTITSLDEAKCPKANYSIVSASASSYWEGFMKAGITSSFVTIPAGVVTNLNTVDSADYVLKLAEAAPTSCEGVEANVKAVFTHV
jgi:hypothetical protein